MKVGDVVRFLKPNEDEGGDRYLVIEDRGDRVLVADLDPYWDDQTLRPQAVYLKAELTVEMTAEERTTRAAFEMMGFNEELTGGNCSAWIMPMRNGRSALVTEDGDAKAPMTTKEPCRLSVLAQDHGEPLKEQSFNTVDDLLGWIERSVRVYGVTSSEEVLERWLAG